MAQNPTPAELEAENEKILKDIDTPSTEEEGKKEEPTEPTEPLDEKREDVAPEAKEEEVAETSTAEVPVEKEAEPSPDYKKKFSESSREAQKKVAANRKLSQAIDEAAEIAEPTEEELQAEYPDYDLLDDTSKKVARDNIKNNRRFEAITKGRAEARKIEKWDEEVSKFTDNPETLIKNPALEGKVDAFKLFASEEKHNSVPFDVLVPAFLHSQADKPKSKGSMFPTGSGGPNDKPKGGKISVADSEILRQTDYNKYKAELKKGNIETAV